MRKVVVLIFGTAFHKTEMILASNDSMSTPKKTRGNARVVPGFGPRKMA
jgi:hypothetical protein